VALTPEELLAAGDKLLSDLSASRLLSQRELEGVRRDLQAGMRADARAGVEAMQSAKIGRTRVLVPNSRNLEQAGIVSRRTRQRMSAFRLRYLDPSKAREMIRLGQIPDDPSSFIRHSRRMARNARDYMRRLGELEPSLVDDDEYQATMAQLEDDNLDLLKFEVKSFTRSRENLQRMVNGRMQRSAALKNIDRTDLSMQLWNQSVLEHPQAVTRNMLANAAERMGQRVATRVSEVPKRSWVYVGVPNDAMTNIRPTGRTAQIGWRLFNTADLDKRASQRIIAGRSSASTWRGLGEGFGTREVYIPVPPENVTPALQELLRQRRAKMMAELNRRRPPPGGGPPEPPAPPPRPPRPPSGPPPEPPPPVAAPGAVSGPGLPTPAQASPQALPASRPQLRAGLKEARADLDAMVDRWDGLAPGATRDQVERLVSARLQAVNELEQRLGVKALSESPFTAEAIGVRRLKAQDSILDLLRDGADLSAGDLAKQLGKHPSSVRQALARLERDGKIVRLKEGRRVTFKVTGKPPVAPPVPPPAAPPTAGGLVAPPGVEAMGAQEAILATIPEGGEVTIQQLAKALNKHPSSVRQALGRLQRDGKIERVKVGKRVTYKVKGAKPPTGAGTATAGEGAGAGTTTAGGAAPPVGGAQGAVWSAIPEAGELTVNELAAAVGKHPSSVRQALARLEKAGHVERVKVGRRVVYRRKGAVAGEAAEAGAAGEAAAAAAEATEAATRAALPPIRGRNQLRIVEALPDTDPPTWLSSRELSDRIGMLQGKVTGGLRGLVKSGHVIKERVRGTWRYRIASEADFERHVAGAAFKPPVTTTATSWSPARVRPDPEGAGAVGPHGLLGTPARGLAADSGWVEAGSMTQARVQLEKLGIRDFNALRFPDQATALADTNILGEVVSDLRARFPQVEVALERRAHGGVKTFQLVGETNLGNIRGGSRKALGQWWPFRSRLDAAMGRTRTAQHRIGAFTNDGSFQGTVRHELGHMMEDNISHTAMAEWRDLYASKSKDWWSTRCSTYGSSDYSEAFAESFSAFTNPIRTQPLDPLIEDYFNRVLYKRTR